MINDKIFPYVFSPFFLGQRADKSRKQTRYYKIPVAELFAFHAWRLVCSPLPPTHSYFHLACAMYRSSGPFVDFPLKFSKARDSIHGTKLSIDGSINANTVDKTLVTLVTYHTFATRDGRVAK